LTIKLKFVIINKRKYNHDKIKTKQRDDCYLKASYGV
jgi:hypothetical protein